MAEFKIVKLPITKTFWVGLFDTNMEMTLHKIEPSDFKNEKPVFVKRLLDPADGSEIATKRYNDPLCLNFHFEMYWAVTPKEMVVNPIASKFRNKPIYGKILIRKFRDEISSPDTRFKMEISVFSSDRFLFTKSRKCKICHKSLAMYELENETCDGCSQTEEKINVCITYNFKTLNSFDLDFNVSNKIKQENFLREAFNMFTAKDIAEVRGLSVLQLEDMKERHIMWLRELSQQNTISFDDKSRYSEFIKMKEKIIQEKQLQSPDHYRIFGPEKEVQEAKQLLADIKVGKVESVYVQLMEASKSLRTMASALSKREMISRGLGRKMEDLSKYDSSSKEEKGVNQAKRCDSCNMRSIFWLDSKACDGNYFQLPGEPEESGYAPNLPGICDSDGAQFEVCLDCFKLQNINKNTIKEAVKRHVCELDDDEAQPSPKRTSHV